MERWVDDTFSCTFFPYVRRKKMCHFVGSVILCWQSFMQRNSKLCEQIKSRNKSARDRIKMRVLVIEMCNTHTKTENLTNWLMFVNIFLSFYRKISDVHVRFNWIICTTFRDEEEESEKISIPANEYDEWFYSSLHDFASSNLCIFSHNECSFRWDFKHMLICENLISHQFRRGKFCRGLI